MEIREDQGSVSLAYLGLGFFDTSQSHSQRQPQSHQIFRPRRSCRASSHIMEVTKTSIPKDHRAQPQSPHTWSLHSSSNCDAKELSDAVLCRLQHDRLPSRADFPALQMIPIDINESFRPPRMPSASLHDTSVGIPLVLAKL